MHSNTELKKAFQALAAAAAASASQQAQNGIQQQDETSYQRPAAAGLIPALEIFRESCPLPEKQREFISDYPTSLFDEFKKIIQKEANKEINDVFVDSPEFQKMIEELNVTKLSKKEKIKILLLSGFNFKDQNSSEEYNKIYEKMKQSNYVNEKLIPYLKENQYMIAIGMYDVNNKPNKEHQELSYNNLNINNDKNVLSINYKVSNKELKRTQIPVETQVIYLLHNVMMD